MRLDQASAGAGGFMAESTVTDAPRAIMRSSRAIRLGARPTDSQAIRLLDIAIAIGVLIFALPLLIGIAIAIKLQDGGQMVFAHERLGRGGRPFKCLKFRSMVRDADAKLAEVLANDPVARAEWARDHKLRRDPRITALGDFLRRSSLDELPQLINVLRGEMSIVGPRPIVHAEISKYGRCFRHYCAVKPGITGLWQVSGRNDVSYRRRVAMDRVYAQRKSFWLDVRLLFLTVPAVLFASGSY